MYYNPTIARLLAKENITIQHGNYHTAWFDIKNRILGLPLWKDMGKDVYDLFIGHEIGHALYTPYEGWHDSPDKIKGKLKILSSHKSKLQTKLKLNSR